MYSRISWSNILLSAHRVHFWAFFLYISELTAIIFLYSINLLVFVTETGCVYCAVRVYV